MNPREYNLIYADGEQTKPGYIWTNPSTLHLLSLATDISNDLDDGQVQDDRFRRFFSAGSVSAQQALAGMITHVNNGIAALPASQQRIPITGGVSQTQSGTTRTINYSDIIYNLNKFYNNYWKPKFDTDGTGVSPYLIRHHPMVQATFVQHGLAIASISLVGGKARIVSVGSHGMYNKMRITITGTGDSDYDDQSFYVKKIDKTTIELYTDSALTTAATAAVSATTGSASLHSSETYRYKMSSLRVFHWGERVYSYMNGNSSAYGARFTGALRLPNNLTGASAESGDMDAKEDPDQGYYSRWASITCTTAAGYLNGISLNDEFPGQYIDPGWTGGQGKHALLEIAPGSITNRKVAGPYTAYEWEIDGYSTAGDKEWPTHIKAVGAKWTIDNPTAMIEAQSGRKFTRTSGMPRYTLSIQYPPMTREQFRPFLTKIMQARGQAVQFHLPLGSIVPGAFNMRGNATKTNMSFIKNEISGTKAFTVGGNDSLIYQALKAGDNIQVPAMGNGEIGIVTHDAHTSAWGTLDLRTTTPLYRNSGHEAMALGGNDIVATLNSDKIDISISTVEHYGFTVEFQTRNWS